MFKNSIGTTNCRRVVSLPSLEHFMASFYGLSLTESTHNNMEKVRAELAKFPAEKVCALHLTSLSVLLQTIATSQSARGNFDSCSKKMEKGKDTPYVRSLFLVPWYICLVPVTETQSMENSDIALSLY